MTSTKFRLYKFFTLLIYLLSLTNTSQAQQVEKKILAKDEINHNTHWKGKKVAFLGDSMTDKRRIGTSYIYWEYLRDMLGIEPFIYGTNGHQWDGIFQQAEELKKTDIKNLDAIFIFAGTNDYMANVPLGSFYELVTKQTNYNGNNVKRIFKQKLLLENTFCSRINRVLDFLKKQFPEQQIILLTPIHRGFAEFNESNIQPDERYTNANGNTISEFVDTLKKASSLWSVPLVDLYTISGLYPMSHAHQRYFTDKKTDMLHPNALGHYRIAKSLYYQLLQLPSSFL
ncbi:SGNH/GDSL hydrolase family protein [Sphingobacterium yanglingense]|uniref:Lysophospholipase L1-like esterase n=1 Tax=Sphingobacterium yanglingense TaxID=1437280 RepID=A0A4R6WN06_9SPHI|nr:SGNH/GDSL hydrolase family protein [Sphingobacterium yanglingense]TDQ80172.1 lysophospholipase L1-like esterase [Sphingobacterium yanglingense]